MIPTRALLNVSFLLGLLMSIGLQQVSKPAMAQDDSTLGPILWRLNQGDQFKVTLTQNSESKVSVDKRIGQVNTQTNVNFHWNVVDASAQKMVIEQSIVSISSEVKDPKVPEQAVAYATNSIDKLDRKSRELLKQVKPLVGLKFVVSMSTRGELLDVSIPPATQKAIDQLPNALRLKALFGKTGLEELLRANTLVFPKDGLPDRWKYEKPIKTDYGTFVRKTDFTLESSDTNPARINTKVSVQLPAENGDRGIKFVSISGEGMIQFDRTRGHVTQASHTYTSVSETPLREKTLETVVTETTKMQIEPKED